MLSLSLESHSAELAMGWSLNVQRGFACGLLQSSHTCMVPPLKGAAPVCMSTLHEELDMCPGDEASMAQELLHSVASVLRSSAEEVTCDARGWKVWKKGEHEIMDKLIPDYAWKVLKRLQAKGHRAYLVGGSVRDMLLKQAPKDFDVITTAELKQVKKGFSQAFIVGKRFPVCNILIQGKTVEVSSFSTVARVPGGYKLPSSCTDSKFKGTWSFTAYRRHQARWENSMRRDFTINGLFYDPFEETLYDYLGGVEDLKKKRVRTVVPANESFLEDSARILRALRIAGRLGFKFSRETAKAIQMHASSITFLPQDRLRLEAKYMMSYGAAECSLRLLWRFGLLEILFPPQAAYLAAQGFKRQEKGSNMLLMLLANLDKLLSPSKPCHCCLWINLFALHLTLCEQPQNPIVVSALALAIRGIDMDAAAVKAIKVYRKYGDCMQEFPELDREALKMSKGRIKRKVLLLCDNIVKALHSMASADYIEKAMQHHPEAPSSNVVMVTKQLLGVCAQLFIKVYKDAQQAKVVEKGEKDHLPMTEKRSKRSIDRKALEEGSLDEVGFVFSHILMSTLYPLAARTKTDAV